MVDALEFDPILVHHPQLVICGSDVVGDMARRKAPWTDVTVVAEPVDLLAIAVD